MRQLLLLGGLLLTGCAITTPTDSTIIDSAIIGSTIDNSAQSIAQSTTQPAQCQGNVVLPPSWQGIATAVTHPTPSQQMLLNSAIGKPTQGKLCQGQVYTVNAPTTLYRAWNSTNPNSRLGSWWAMDAPQGAVAQYRKNYESAINGRR